MKYFTLAGLLLAGFSAFSQVDVDKSINLSGAGSNAKISGIKNVSAAQDALSVEAYQKGAFIYGGLSTGSSTAYVISLAPGLSAAYTAGMILYFKAHTACGNGPVSLDAGLGAVTIKKNGNQNLASGDIASQQVASV